MMSNENTAQLNSMGDRLINIGSLLMSSGANTGRVRLTLERISEMREIESV